MFTLQKTVEGILFQGFLEDILSNKAAHCFTSFYFHIELYCNTIKTVTLFTRNTILVHTYIGIRLQFISLIK